MLFRNKSNHINPSWNIKERVFKKGFINQINIINAEFKGQVKQRIIAYKYCDSELIMHMDDDIILDIQILKNLINDYSLARKSMLCAEFMWISIKGKQPCKD